MRPLDWPPSSEQIRPVALVWLQIIGANCEDFPGGTHDNNFKWSFELARCLEDYNMSEPYIPDLPPHHIILGAQIRIRTHLPNIKLVFVGFLGLFLQKKFKFI